MLETRSQGVSRAVLFLEAVLEILFHALLLASGDTGDL
jgi:hypothetical protein